mmetsp:Transcript_3042/g.7584  ORF Transcript_3042/g.7584 Transcript_3042/m.7584 type:complete len:229 (+) Transcript_3042:3201-3887(+)
MVVQSKSNTWPMCVSAASSMASGCAAAMVMALPLSKPQQVTAVVCLPLVISCTSHAYSSGPKAASTWTPLGCHPTQVGCSPTGPSNVRMGMILPLIISSVRLHTCTRSSLMAATRSVHGEMAMLRMVPSTSKTRMGPGMACPSMLMCHVAMWSLQATTSVCSPSHSSADTCLSVAGSVRTFSSDLLYTDKNLPLAAAMQVWLHAMCVTVGSPSPPCAAGPGPEASSST